MKRPYILFVKGSNRPIADAKSHKGIRKKIKQLWGYNPRMVFIVEKWGDIVGNEVHITSWEYTYA